MLPESDMPHAVPLWRSWDGSSQKEHSSKVRKLVVRSQVAADGDMYRRTDSETYHIREEKKLCVSKPSVLLHDKEFICFDLT